MPGLSPELQIHISKCLPNIATLVVWYLIFNSSKTESLTFFSQNVLVSLPPSQLPVISFFQQLKSTYLEISLPPHFLLHLITICQQILWFSTAKHIQNPTISHQLDHYIPSVTHLFLSPSCSESFVTASALGLYSLFSTQRPE